MGVCMKVQRIIRTTVVEDTATILQRRSHIAEKRPLQLKMRCSPYVLIGVDGSGGYTTSLPFSSDIWTGLLSDMRGLYISAKRRKAIRYACFHLFSPRLFT